MTTEIYHPRQNISYKYKFSILVAIVSLGLSRLGLQGSGIEQELFKYFLPLIAGGSVGLLIGHLLDNSRKSLQLYRQNIITLKKKMEEQRVRETWYAALFEKNHSIIILLNPTTGRIEEANPRACEFYGYSIEQFKQMHISELDTLPKGQIPYETSQVKTEKRQKFFLKHKLASGEKRDVELFSGSIVIDGTSFLFLVVNDITGQKVLRGIIPICAHCKQIRDCKGDWHQIEEYIQRHSEAKFSHGLCPTCAQQHYPTIYQTHNI